MSDKTLNKANLAMVNTLAGDLHPYLKGVDLFGRIAENGDFVIYGCANDESVMDAFYKGILAYDQADAIHGFETVADVKEYWEECGDMLLMLNSGEYEIIKQISGQEAHGDGR